MFSKGISKERIVGLGEISQYFFGHRNRTSKSKVRSKETSQVNRVLENDPATTEAEGLEAFRTT